MELNNLTAISPVDGRYRKQVAQFAEYFSEYGLMKYRVLVEVRYFIFLADKRFFNLSEKAKDKLIAIAENFNLNDAARIKEIEAITNHDVKAVEYFLKEGMDKANIGAEKEWVHFGLTSQDINNTAIPLSWKDCLEKAYLPTVAGLVEKLKGLAEKWKGVAMLAHTHGQPASPTKLGKEFMVFVERIENQLKLFAGIPFTAKFGGATGNFNAHNIAFPKKDWKNFGDEFIKTLGLQRLQYTTQIEHYDYLAAHSDAIRRINNILVDLCRDLWMYISMEYFRQKVKKNEVGSSAMPHKVNPIDFENAEGNLGVANALLEHFASKLPVSRLQRDLTDSTVLRNLGVPIAHTFIAVLSIEKGLNKIVLNQAKLRADLEDNWAVVAEAIQTILRRENYPNPYEALKALTRGNSTIDKSSIHKFIDELKVSTSVKKELKKITPQNYTGV